MEDTKDKKCLYCGEIFEDNKYGNKLFCSTSCKKKYHYNNSVYEKNCSVCGKPFKGKAGAKVCSHNCSLKAQKNTRKTCPVCGKKFYARGNGLYCSDMCYRTATSKTKGLTVAYCEVCNKPFKTWIKEPELTCSDECSAQLIPTM